MSIFDLQDVLNQRVRCQTVAEVFLGFFKPLALDLASAMLDHEIVEERHSIGSFMDFINAHRVCNHLDQATVWSSRQDLVSLKPKWQLFYPKDLIDLRD